MGFNNLFFRKKGCFRANKQEATLSGSAKAYERIITPFKPKAEFFKKGVICYFTINYKNFNKA